MKNDGFLQLLRIIGGVFVTTNRIQRTVRMSVLSTLIALVAFSFLAFGSASAHTISQAQIGSGISTSVVRIKDDQFGRAMFHPSAISVISGTPVRIVNKTPSYRFLFIAQGDVVLSPGASTTLIVTQSQYVRICAGGTLTITIV